MLTRCGGTVISFQSIVMSRPSALRGEDAGHIREHSMLPGLMDQTRLMYGRALAPIHTQGSLAAV